MSEWRQVPQPELFLAVWRRESPDVDPPRAYQHRNGLTALVGREPVADDDWRWHISVRYGRRGSATCEA